MTDLISHSFLKEPVTLDIWERLQTNREVATYLVKSANKLDLEALADRLRSAS